MKRRVIDNHPDMPLVEGLIFAVGRIGIERKYILEKVPTLSKEDLEGILDSLKRKYPNDGTSGIVLTDFGKVLSLATYSGIGEQVAEALVRKKQKELSDSLMEVLAIVAYQQPITKAEVEQIREGKNCDYALGALSEAGLVTVVGRKDTIGRPMLYGTTQVFLERFELASLKKLPSRKEIEERIAVIKTAVDDGGMLFVDTREEIVPLGDEVYEETDLEEDSLVGAGEEGGYDDTDYDMVAADDTETVDDEE